MVCAKSPLGCSTSRQFLKSSTSRWKASRSPSPRFAEQMGRLADEVEREVGEAEVDFEHRRMAAPFAEPLAEDQRVVAEAQQIVRAGVELSPAEAGVQGAAAAALARSWAPAFAGERPSYVLHLVRDVVEGRVAVDLALGRLEQLARLVGVGRDDVGRGTTHRLTPSCRRV